MPPINKKTHPKALGYRKITPLDMEAILAMVEAGIMYTQICEKIGVAYATIYKMSKEKPEWGAKLKKAGQKWNIIRSKENWKRRAKQMQSMATQACITKAARRKKRRALMEKRGYWKPKTHKKRKRKKKKRKKWKPKFKTKYGLRMGETPRRILQIVDQAIEAEKMVSVKDIAPRIPCHADYVRKVLRENRRDYWQMLKNELRSQCKAWRGTVKPELHAAEERLRQEFTAKNIGPLSIRDKTTINKRRSIGWMNSYTSMNLDELIQLADMVGMELYARRKAKIISKPDSPRSTKYSEDHKI